MKNKKIIKKDKSKKIVVISVLTILAISSIIIFLIPFSYQASEFYNVQEPYSYTEKYTEIVSGKNCDYSVGCRCVHESWFGLGACDSCKCNKEKTVTKYRTIQKERPITKEDTLFNMITKNTQYIFYE